MKTIYVQEVRKILRDRYDVLIARDDGSEVNWFTFHVEGGGIHVVTASDEFERYMEYAGGAAKRIFAAILAVHEARATVPEP
jgi:hypothetical protein